MTGSEWDEVHLIGACLCCRKHNFVRRVFSKTRYSLSFNGNLCLYFFDPQQLGGSRFTEIKRYTVIDKNLLTAVPVNGAVFISVFEKGKGYL